ncbi:hypothetical protein EYF80_009862 [Liparis tanakae]|uniref:Uncharacterized protein n=1 Tax=Liparis tanakae TaxID=230148 RepID=A0A4Z2IPK6_9TELE|nr:hypothetical protein EYF80_009862 [Liparis tanakae]
MAISRKTNPQRRPPGAACVIACEVAGLRRLQTRSVHRSCRMNPVLRVSLGGSSLTGVTVTETETGRLRRSISGPLQRAGSAKWIPYDGGGVGYGELDPMKEKVRRSKVFQISHFWIPPQRSVKLPNVFMTEEENHTPDCV